MTRSSPRGRSFPFPALRGGGGFLLLSACLLLGACSVGIDDRPVPPEMIPNVSMQQTGEAQTFGAPSGAIERVAAPSYAAAEGGSADMVWRTGAQPVAGARESLAEPDAAEAEEQAQPAETPEATAVAGGEPGEAPAFRLAPFVGLDAQAAGPLRAAMRSEAARRGIVLGEVGDGLVLKGYLSSLDNDGTTVLTYVWDVYDASGTRLNRIDGQQDLPEGVGTDPLSVDAPTARAVASRTLDALAGWRPPTQG